MKRNTATLLTLWLLLASACAPAVQSTAPASAASTTTPAANAPATDQARQDALAASATILHLTAQAAAPSMTPAPEVGPEMTLTAAPMEQSSPDLATAPAIPTQPTPLPAPLTVTPSPVASATPPAATSAGCGGAPAWFFDHQGACPEAPPAYSYAAAQRFERGQMIWVEATDVFYILFDAGAYPGDSRQVYRSLGPLAWKPGASADNRAGEAPPVGLYEPVSGFGLIWRNEVEGLDADIRAALGWAREAEFGFETVFQCAQQQTYSARTCYLRHPSGRVIELGWGAYAGQVWQER